MTDKPNFGEGYDGGTGKTAPIVSATEIFDEAAHTITQQRGAVYGHPIVDFSRVATVKAILSDCPDPVIRHAMEMVAVKLCRLIETPDHVDSWIDIAGYARTACMVIDAKKEGRPDGQATS